jgi:uncharacterized protein with PIN domain
MVCAVDCEWRPNTSPPHATLLQLACWSAAYGVSAIILDLLVLGADEAAAQEVSAMLRALFRHSKTLKVGYGLAHDMCVLCNALGSGCISIAEPAVDVRLLHPFLLHQHMPGVLKVRCRVMRCSFSHAFLYEEIFFGGRVACHTLERWQFQLLFKNQVQTTSLPACFMGFVQVEERGLSSIVSVHLGAALDKSMQCSDWGHRPLTAEQLEYAAADALCLLSLLSHFICCAEESGWPVLGQEDAVWVSTPAFAAGHHDEDEANALCVARDGMSTAQLAVVEDNGGTFSAKGPKQHRNSGITFTAEQISKASSFWGNKLTNSGNGESRPKKTRGRKEKNGEHLVTVVCIKISCWWNEDANAILTCPHIFIPPCPFLHTHCSAPAAEQQRSLQQQFPVSLPWQAGGSPAFLADNMLAGLARQLRLLGFDAEALPPSSNGRWQVSGHMQRPGYPLFLHTNKLRNSQCTQLLPVQNYRALVDRSKEEARVILTKDRHFITSNYADTAYYVRCDGKGAQCEEVIGAFGLEVGKTNLLSRCVKCEFVAEKSGSAHVFVVVCVWGVRGSCYCSSIFSLSRILRPSLLSMDRSIKHFVRLQAMASLCSSPAPGRCYRRGTACH